MTSRASWWRRIFWRLTPLGRVRLALAETGEDHRPDAGVTRLRSSLVTLKQPSRFCRPEVAVLARARLGRLTELALMCSDFNDASETLAELDQLGGTPDVRLPLRY